MSYREWLLRFYHTNGRMPNYDERMNWQGGGGGDGDGTDGVGDGGTEPPVDPTEPDSTLTPELSEILEEFRNALATFTVQPGFVTGEGGEGGWSGPVAGWLRQNAGNLENMFLEQYMKQSVADPGAELPEYEPMDWLSKFDPEQAYRMTPPSGYTAPPGWRSPVTTVRRLRI